MSDIRPDDDLPGDDVPGAFPAAARAWITRLFQVRRDVRHFAADRPVPEDMLRRVLGAAHLAPSVGFSQPWRFVLLRDSVRRARIRESFLACRSAEAARFSDTRRKQYLALKLEGIVDAPLNICVVADLRPQGEAILGTTVQPESVRASVLCAVQNLWLSARAEGLGVGWVSVVEPAVLRAELALPPGVEPVAYLCLGFPARPYPLPMLEAVGWKTRLPLDDVICEGGFSASSAVVPSRASHPLETSPLDALPAVAPLDTSRGQVEHDAWAQMIVPFGSCGRLTQLATYWALRRPEHERPAPALLVFAADHGVTSEGVSAYGSFATVGILGALMAEQSTCSVLAARFGIPLTLCDVGTASDRSRLPREPRVALLDRRVAAGTRNLRHEAAMSPSELERALSVGRECVTELADRGKNLLGLGEVGIGNTTSAAAIAAALLGLDPDCVAGHGTGLDAQHVQRKARVIRDALSRLGSRCGDARAVLCEVGGFELVALTGAIIEASRRGLVVVLDGAVTCAAALAAERLQPGSVGYCLASHRSAERSASVLLTALGLEPLFAWDLAVGEGAGAAFGIDVMQTALSVRRAVATFPEAGLVDRSRMSAVLPRRAGD